MKPIHWAILAVIASLLLAAGAYYWATGMMDATFGYRSPIRNTPPPPGQPANPALTHRVVFVLIDALRYDTSQNAQVMPVLNQLRAQGASARMHSQVPSYSEPGYTVLLTGAWPDISDGPPINLDYAEIHTFTQDDLFSATRRAGLKTAISGYYWFEKLVPQGAVDGKFYTPLEDRTADRQVVDAALPWLRGGAYQLVLIHLDQVDYAGHHEGGPRSPNWDAAAARADALLGEVLATLDLTQDTIFVCSDHGQIDAGGHGGQDPVVLVEPFVLAGKGVKPGNYGEVNMVDVAPTLAALLGTSIPASSEGQPLTSMLDLTDTQASAIKHTAEAQQVALMQVYEKAIASYPSHGLDVPPVEAISTVRQLRLERERLPRAIVALIIFMIPLGLILWRRGRDLPWLLAGALLYVALFNLRYAVLDGRTYSLSSVTGVSDLITYIAITGLVALLLSVALLAWRLRLFMRRPADVFLAILKLSLLAVYMLSIPVLVSYALNGWKPTWTLPDFLTAFLALLSSIQILIVAAGGLVLGLVAMGVKWVFRIGSLTR
jgi:hypothetical protein